MTDDRRSDAEKNQALTEQVKLLVRTEQRLFRAQRSFEAQLLRMELLSSFALKAGRAASETALLEQVLELLLSAYPYDQAVAFVASGEDSMRAVASASVPGRAFGSRRLIAEEDLVTVVPLPDLLHPMGLVDVINNGAPLPLAAALGAMERIFAGGDPAPARACLTLPISCDGKFTALLIARKVDTLVSHTEPLPAATDVPFWRLLTRHIETTLEAFRLKARMQTVLANLPNALVVLRGQKILAGNRRTAQLLGYTSETELEGLPLSEVVPEDELTPLRRNPDDTGQDTALRLIGRNLLRKDGVRVPVEIVLVPLAFEGSPATLLIAEDMTERARMRTELAHAERLAAIGVLAAGVAHEVNNPLTYMLFHLDALLKNPLDPSQKRTLELVHEGATRIRDIVRDLTTFASAQEDTGHAVAVEAVIDKVLALAEPEVRCHARVLRDFEPLPAVFADEGRLAQVFLNLLINAAQAMDTGDPERNVLSIRGRSSAGSVVIEIADTGSGISSENLKRIFEPFFSTKMTSRGSGLGLSISRNIIERFGGRIEVSTTLGGGSCFSVYLLVASDQAPASQRLPPNLTLPPSRPRVLVIDDDQQVLSVCAMILEEECDVIAALGGAAALPLLEESLDAVVCDLMMPGMTGMDLYDWVSEHRPGLARRVVFLTGGSFTARTDEFLNRTGVPVVEKPMRAEELMEAVRAAGKRR